MAGNTNIEWADHTFNPWEGCQKVGPGCDNCYADARPMHPDWARSLRDQCQAAGVPFFFKQWGEFAPTTLGLPCVAVSPGGSQENGWDYDWQNGDANMVRLGKKVAGRLLDRREHSEFPE